MNIYFSGFYFLLKFFFLFYYIKKRKQVSLFETLIWSLVYIIIFIKFSNFNLKILNSLIGHFSLGNNLSSLIFTGYFIIDFLSSIFVGRRYKSERTGNPIILNYEYSIITAMITNLLLMLPAFIIGMIEVYRDGGFDWLLNRR